MNNRSKLLFYIGAIGNLLMFAIAGYLLLYYREYYTTIDSKAIQTISIALVWLALVPLVYLLAIYGTLCASRHMKKTLIKCRIALTLQIGLFILISLPDIVYDKVNHLALFVLAAILFVIGMILHYQIGKEVIAEGISYKEENAKDNQVSSKMDKMAARKWSKWLNWIVAGVVVMAGDYGHSVMVNVCIVSVGLAIQLFFTYKYIQTYRSMPDAKMGKVTVIGMYVNVVVSNALGLVLCIVLYQGFLTFIVFASALYMKFRADEKYRTVIEERLGL